MPTLDPTVGGATANTYCTLQEALDYWDGHALSASKAAFEAANQNDQSSALIQATMLLDSCFIWTGLAVGATQLLGWPRMQMLNRNGFPIDTGTIPIQLKWAEAEWAGQLLANAGRTDNNDALDFNLSSLRAGDVTLNFDTIGKNSGSLPLRDADVIRRGPDFDYLWKAVPDAARNLIAPSWYRRTTVSRPLIVQSTR